MLTLEGLDARLTVVEHTLEDAVESSLPTELENLRHIVAKLSAKLDEQSTQIAAVLEQSKSNGAALAKFSEVVGESPDLSTGKPGTGMRKQLSDLVDKQRVPPFVQWLTPVIAVVIGIYQALKAAGVAWLK
jgi:hypothetical protein